MMKNIILFIVILCFMSCKAQNSAQETKKSLVPTSYAITATKTDKKRLVKIDLDSILLNNNTELQDIIKGDSTLTIVTYTPSVTTFQADSATNNMRIYMQIEVKTVKSQAMQDIIAKEVEKLDKAIEEDLKHQEEKRRRKEQLTKQ